MIWMSTGQDIFQYWNQVLSNTMPEELKLKYFSQIRCMAVDRKTKWYNIFTVFPLNSKIQIHCYLPWEYCVKSFKIVSKLGVTWSWLYIKTKLFFNDILILLGMMQWTIMVSIKISLSCYVQLDGCMDYFCVQSFSHFFNARSKSDLLLFSKNFGNQNVHFVFFS